MGNSSGSEQSKAKKRPKRPLQFEPNFASYLADREYNPRTLHVNKKRAIKKVQDYFYTFEWVLDSDLLTQQYKNEMFNSSLLDSFGNKFQFYDRENTEAEEQNKLHIAIDGITRGIHYFQNRYPESSLAYKQAEQIHEFLQMLSQVTARKAEDEKAIEFYKTRHTMLLPPKFLRPEKRYIALCRVCWGYSEYEDVKKAVSTVHHYKKCPYDKNDLERCIEVISPKNPIKNK